MADIAERNQETRLTLVSAVPRGGSGDRFERDFCGELLSPKVGPGESRVVAFDESFALIPSLGPLALGHCLLVPWAHRLSIATSGPPDRVLAAVETASRLIASVFGVEPVVFEHGATGALKRGGCGVDHAHLHLVPSAPPTRLPELEGVAWRRTDTTSWIREAQQCPADSDYLYLSVPGVPAVIGWTGQTASQALRKWLAHEIGAEHWDWRDHGASGDVMVRRATVLLRQALDV